MDNERNYVLNLQDAGDMIEEPELEEKAVWEGPMQRTWEEVEEDQRMFSLSYMWIYDIFTLNFVPSP